MLCVYGLEEKGKTLLNNNPMILCGMATIDIYTGSSQLYLNLKRDIFIVQQHMMK